MLVILEEYHYDVHKGYEKTVNFDLTVQQE